jgi:hypothetical protein
LALSLSRDVDLFGGRRLPLLGEVSHAIG